MRRLRSPRYRARNWVALFLVSYLADCIFVGFTPGNFLLTRGVEISTSRVTENRYLFIGAGRSTPIDACFSDSDGYMYLFIHQCARRRPWLFHWSSSGDGEVRYHDRQLVGVRPGTFTLHVSAMGKRDSIQGEVLSPDSLLLSTYDTTLRVGEELLVGVEVRKASGSRVLDSLARFHEAEPAGNVTWQALRWSRAPAIRVQARGAGRACLALVTYSQVRWLRILVMDSASSGGAGSADSSAARCGDGTDSVDGSSRRAPLPTPAATDTVTLPGARLAFAFQSCMARTAARGEAARQQPIGRTIGACADSVQPLGSTTGDGGSWRFSYSEGPGSEDYSEFGRPIAGARARRRVSVQSTNPAVHVHDDYDFDGHTVQDREVTLQSAEVTTVRALAACARLHRRQAGNVPETFAALRAFALATVLARGAASDTSDGCNAEALGIERQQRGGGSGEAMHESGQFIIRYVPRGDRFTLESRPARWGETGVLTFRIDEAGQEFGSFESSDH